MKTNLLLLITLLIAGSLNGQAGRNELPEREINRSLNPSTDLYPFQENDTSFTLRRNFDLHIDRLQELYSKQKNLLQDSIQILISTKSRSEEMYPGSSVFYAKKPLPHPYGYEKSFILKPDTSVKYYLIIKDPITHKITR